MSLETISMSAQAPKHVTLIVKESYRKKFLAHNYKCMNIHSVTLASAVAVQATSSVCVLQIAVA